jgi:TnpA family transposase
MTSIERTAYPYLTTHKIISHKTLEACYILNEQERAYINQHIRGDRLQFNFAIQLKTFQSIHYFIPINDVPTSILTHIRKQLGFHHKLQPFYEHQKTLLRHRENIRQYMNVASWSTQGQHSPQRIAMQAAAEASQTMNNPADIMNVVIEYLIEKRIELPAFATLDRLVCHVRAKVNQTIFKNVLHQLQTNQLIETLDKLLIVEKEETYSAYQKLKTPPKAPTVTNFKNQVKHHDWLMGLGQFEPYLLTLPKVKLKQFAGEAKSLDVNNLKDLSAAKKYTLIACLLYQAQQIVKDSLCTFVCKTLFYSHKQAKRKLVKLKENIQDETKAVAQMMLDSTTDYKEKPRHTKAFASKFKKRIDTKGGTDNVISMCQKIIAYHSKNHLPFLWDYFKGKRSALFDFIHSIQVNSSTHHQSILKALMFLKDQRFCRADHLILTPDVDVSFISGKWKKVVFVDEKEKIVNRRYLELCLFSTLANELRSGDMFIHGADAYSDYRQHLSSLAECEPLMEDYLSRLNIPHKEDDAVTFLQNKLLEKARMVDELYPNLPDFEIDADGTPMLKKTPTAKPSKHTTKMVEKIHHSMPERSLLDVLCLTHHLTGWAHEFGHISGADTKLENPIERYILNVFCQGTAMGSSQGAKHIKNVTVSPRMLSWINRRHVTPKTLDKAKNRIINQSKIYHLTTAWGDGSRCAADGTLQNIYEDNLLAEAHFRYKAKGGIAYNHIADTYVALFSTFMPCGLWEAVEIIEGLLKNDSDIQPRIVHADTQGQSTVVFGISYLLGITLMPRIRNWKDLIFYRPNSEKYKNIDALFRGEIDWDIIRTHWKDMMQVILSVHQGKISTSFLLRKLTNYSRKNRLFIAFQELGRVIRTLFLLDYISNPKLREVITASTNKVESYNAFTDWIAFGARVLVASNDPDEMEKAIKYNAFIANCMILHNIIDYSYVVYQLQQQGYNITKEDLAHISPYATAHFKRFGDYFIDLQVMPEHTEMIQNARLF